MTNVTLKVEQAIKIQCVHCGGEDVTVDFSAGTTRAVEGDTGYLKFSCEDCDAITQIDEE